MASIRALFQAIRFRRFYFRCHFDHDLVWNVAWPLTAHNMSTTRIARKMYSNAFGSLKIWPVVLSWLNSLFVWSAFIKDLHYIWYQIPFFRLWVVSNEWHVEVNTSVVGSVKKQAMMFRIYIAHATTHTHTQTTNAFSVILMMMMTRSRCRPRGHWFFSFSVWTKAFYSNEDFSHLAWRRRPEPVELCNVKCERWYLVHRRLLVHQCLFD